jgi:ABC-type lipoprotein export system ATPase subunit
MAHSGWRPTEGTVAPAIDGRAVRWQPPTTSDDALRGLDLHIAGGELVVVSGSGAHTLLRLLAGLTPPHDGDLVVGSLDLATADESALAAHRRATGVLLGDAEANLLPALSALENVALPLRLAGLPPEECASRAAAMLARLGVESEPGTRPTFTAAERRLAALAAALVSEPRLLLLEDPARALEAPVAEDVFQVVRERSERGGATVVVAADDGVFLRRAARVIVLHEGRAVVERVRRMAFARGEGELVHELATVDGAGRVNIAPAVLAALGIERRAVVTEASDHIELRPERPPSAAPERAWRRQP